MAIPVTSIAEIRASATANNVNAGYFDPGDAFSGLTDGAATSATGNSPVFSSATYTFVAGDDESWVYIKSGSNWRAGFYQIASVSGGAATLRAAIGEAVQFNATTGKWEPNTVAGCATTASPTGATFGVDYSQQDSAKLTNTDLANATGTNATVTSAGGGFTPAMVGNFMHITAGTNFTTGWYKIVAYNSANSVDLDRDPTASGAGSAGTFFVGGAMSMNSTLDDDFFETATATNGSGACTIFVRGAAGAVSLGEAVSISATGGTQNPINVIGYASIRGDNPVASTRPLISCGANALTFGTNWNVSFVRFTGTSTPGVSAGIASVFSYCKSTNTSTTAGRAAFTGAADVVFFACEGISYRGNAFAANASAGWVLDSCWFHASNWGVTTPASSTPNGSLLRCIFSGNVAGAIDWSNCSNTGRLTWEALTLYGAADTRGTGINLNAANTDVLLKNSIISGFATGITHPTTTQTVGQGDYNDYYNNDTDVSGWLKGQNDKAVDPSFTNVSEVNGTAGAFTAANDRLVDTTKNFTALGVVAGDYLYIISGTGATAGIYGISSITTTTNPNDTLVLDIAPGTNTTTDKTYQIAIGHNFLPTGNI